MWKSVLIVALSQQAVAMDHVKEEVAMVDYVK